MANTEDLRTPMTAAIEAQVKHDQEPWDGRVTVQWPLMSNPFTMTDSAEPPIMAGGPSVAQVAFLQEPQPVPSGDGPAPEDIGCGKRGAERCRRRGEKDEAQNARRREDRSAPRRKTTRSTSSAPRPCCSQPGKHQFDIGLEYTLTENDFPILLTDGRATIVGVDNVEFKGRELAVPMELR